MKRVSEEKMRKEKERAQIARERERDPHRPPGSVLRNRSIPFLPSFSRRGRARESFRAAVSNVVRTQRDWNLGGRRERTTGTAKTLSFLKNLDNVGKGERERNTSRRWKKEREGETFRERGERRRKGGLEMAFSVHTNIRTIQYV